MRDEFEREVAEAQKLMCDVVNKAKEIIKRQFFKSGTSKCHFCYDDEELEIVEAKIEEALKKEKVWINDRECISYLSWDNDGPCVLTVRTEDEYGNSFDYNLDDLEDRSIIDLALIFTSSINLIWH